MRRGNIIDFMRVASENEELQQDLIALAAKHEFQFTADGRGEDGLDDAALDDVAGGVIVHGWDPRTLRSTTIGRNLGMLSSLSKVLGVESTTFPNPVRGTRTRL